MEEKDYYKILGIARDADDSAIKKAYRRLAMQYHPDRCKGDKSAEERFKEINEAYEVLKDPEKRARYDRFGYAGVGRGFGEGGFGVDFEDFFGDIVSDFFGGKRRRGPEPGSDLRYDMEIGFEEAIFGTTKTINIPKTVQCPSCRGARAKPGTSPSPCPSCKGTGEASFQQGFFRITRTCSTCRGQGVIIKTPCDECRGRGLVETTHKITLNVPAGVDTGSRLRVSGEGGPGAKGGRPGDLYVFLSVKPHPIFKRENSDIIYELPITFPQATLGIELEIPTLEGPARLKIPAGTQTGKTFRLRGKGVTSLKTGRRGDLIIAIKIETPTGLNKKQRELLEEFAKISNDDVFPEKKGFFEKVKEIFG